MPITTAAASSVFLSYLSGAGIVGVSASQLASGLASGLTSYLRSGVRVQTVDAGTAGAGRGTGFAVLTPASTVPAMSASFAGASMLGLMAAPLASAVAQAVSQCVSMATVSTTSPSVGVGSGAGFLIPTSSFQFFSASLRASGLSGSWSDALAAAVSSGLDAALRSAVVTVAIAGPASTVPSGGSGTGSLS